jgi:hypothetical protein
VTTSEPRSPVEAQTVMSAALVRHILVLVMARLIALAGFADFFAAVFTV